MIAVVFVAESVPTFGPMLDLVGGSGITLASTIFPALFYLYLLAAQKKNEDGNCSSEETANLKEYNFFCKFLKF